MDKEQGIDLTLEPTESLIEELVIRYPKGLVIAMFLPLKDTSTKKEVEYDVHLSGAFESTLCLTKYLEWEHQEQIQQTQEIEDFLEDEEEI